MTERALTARVDSGSIDMKTGEFPMVLASDGEASDGDILSIEGAIFDDHAPLQNAHGIDAVDTFGSITAFRRDLKSTPKKLRAKGRIELEGDGSMADIRRDVAFMISRGHIRGVSVRWEPIEWVRRTNLPEDHPHYVDGETEKDWRKRYGLFFKKWRVREGSIAPVQADLAAVVGRAEETEGQVAAFWRAIADDEKASRERALQPPDPAKFEERDDYVRAAMPRILAEIDAADDEREEKAERLAVHQWDAVHSTEPVGDDLAIEPAEPEKPAEEPSREAVLAAAAAQLRELESMGLSVEEIAQLIDEQRAQRAPTVEDLAAIVKEQREEIEAMRAQLASLEQGRVNGAPAPPSFHNVREIINHLDSMLAERRAQAIRAAEAMVRMRVGKVDPETMSYRQLMHAEVQKMLEERDAKRQPAEGEAPALASTLAKLESMLADRARARLAERNAPKE